MKKNLFLCCLMSVCVFAISACGSSPDRVEKIVQDVRVGEKIPATEFNLAEASSGEQTENSLSQGSITQFDSGKFSGDIEGILYAKDSRILVYADHFQLYDIAADAMIGEFSVDEGRILERKFFSLSDGYALVGAVFGGASSSSFSSDVRNLKCWYFDKNFVCQKTVDLSALVSESGDAMAFSAAVSEDGNKIGITGNDAVYLYDVTASRLGVLFHYNEAGYAQKVSVSELGFVNRGGKLVFTGSVPMSGGSENVPFYGMVSADGSGLVCHTSSGYELSNEMIPFENEIWFPEAFDKAAGKMLVTDTNGQTIRIVDFEGEDTGADGVFASDHGKYIATIQWMPKQSCWRVRIYNATSGNIVHEQMVEVDEEKYSSIVCKVLILDEWNECIVVAGRNQQTFISSFFF